MFIKRSSFLMSKRGFNYIGLSFLLFGFIFIFLSLLNLINLYINRANYEYLFSVCYFVDSYEVRLANNSNGRILIRSVPFSLGDSINTVGFSRVNSSFVEGNIYTNYPDYRGLKFYIEYNAGYTKYYYVNKNFVY